MKKNDRKSVFEIEQPFDLFEGFDDAPPAYQYPPSTPRAPKPRRSHKRWWLALGFIALVIVGFVGVGFLKNKQMNYPYVFLEVKTISPKGRAVTGSQVYIDKRQVGLTDSFGEWRRYLRIKPGRKIKLDVKKRYRNKLYTASRVVQIPTVVKSGKSKENEIRVNLMLQPQGTSVNVAENQKEKPVSQAEKRDSKADFTVPASYLSDHHLQSIDIRFNNFNSRFGTLMEKHQADVLRTKVLPELIAQTSESNLKMSRQADWKLAITYIPQKNSVGLIHASVSWLDQNGRPQQNSFLTNFAKTIEQTASDLLRMTKKHTRKLYGAFSFEDQWYAIDNPANFWRLNQETILRDQNGGRYRLKASSERKKTSAWQLVALDGKSKPCSKSASKQACMLRSEDLRDAPPSRGWSVQKFKFSGSLPPQAEVFVGGYRAFATRNGQWLFWGLGSDRMRLTIVRNKSLYLRQWLTVEGNQTPIVRLPGSSISRRNDSSEESQRLRAY